MASYKVILYNRAKKNGLHSLVLYIHINATRAYHPIEKEIPSDIWNEDTQSVKKGYGGDNKEVLNSFILKWRGKASKLLMQLEESGRNKDISAKEFIDLLTGTSLSKLTPKEYLDNHIETLTKLRKFGNSKVYSDLLGVLNRYCAFSVITFSKINYSFIKGFDDWMIEKNFKPNSRNFYHSKLRALLNSAGKELEYYSKSENPYIDFEMPKEKTKKRHLSLSEVKSIYKAKGIARDYFIWSLFHVGIDVADYFYLNHDNVSKDRIRYNRRKTNAPIDIALIKVKFTSSFNLDLTKKVNDDKTYQFFLGWRKRLNLKLHNLAKELELDLDFPLTTKVTRHTWAMLAKDMGVPVDVIGEMLGHSIPSVTGIYLGDFRKDLKDNVQKKVSKLVTSR